MLVQERVGGIPILNFNALKNAQIDLKRLAERGVEIFFTQVFRDCFFHADMHPGNIFVSPDDPKSPRYIAVDFGIMGCLDESDQYYLAANFIAFFERDYRRVAELHVESGWVPADTRVSELEAAIRTVCEPIFEKPLKDISYGQVLLRLFQTGKRFNMESQPQLLLLQKTLLAVEGLGRQLYPDLDLWHSAKPYLEKWLKQRTSPKVIMKKMKEQAVFLTNKLPEMPVLLYDVLNLTKQKIKQQQQIKRDRYGSLASNIQYDDQMWREKKQGRVGTTLLLVITLVLGFGLGFWWSAN